MPKKDKIKPVIVFTGGSFDMLHAGHLNILKKAKSLGDFLIVGVSTNTLIRSYKDIDPIMNYQQRFELVQAIKFVDMAVKQEQIFDVKQFKLLNADLFVIGDDWKGRMDVPGLNWLRKHKKVFFVPYTKGLSSSIIKEKIIRSSFEIIKSQTKSSG